MFLAGSDQDAAANPLNLESISTRTHSKFSFLFLIRQLAAPKPTVKNADQLIMLFQNPTQATRASGAGA